MGDQLRQDAVRRVRVDKRDFHAEQPGPRLVIDQLGPLGPLAVRELQRAIELRRDYWPPYVALSDYYKESGDFATARKLLENVVSFAPEAPGVKRRLAALDGVKTKSTQRAISDEK
jgi:hypothetical protein